MTCEIRPAQHEDASAISQVITDSLRRSNARDYAEDIIERLVSGFNRAAVSEFIRTRKVFVAEIDSKIVGTVSFDGKSVRSLFVTPEFQKQHVGRKLMETVEKSALDAGINILSLRSSVTAVQFYEKLGYVSTGENYHGDERTISMQRNLTE